MAQKIPQRLVWAVETLDVQPDDVMLEIGSGHGVAAALIGAKLVTGTLTAIDRSDTMTTAASRRNRSHIDSGRADFRTASLAEFEPGKTRFDKIFAVNVNLFWMDADAELRVIASLLKPDGRLYLFYEPPDAAKCKTIADMLAKNLRENDFAVLEVLFKDLKPLSGIGVIARKA